MLALQNLIPTPHLILPSILPRLAAVEEPGSLALSGTPSIGTSSGDLPIALPIHLRPWSDVLLTAPADEDDDEEEEDIEDEEDDLDEEEGEDEEEEYEDDEDEDEDEDDDVIIEDDEDDDDEDEDDVEIEDDDSDSVKRLFV
jgi:hypothetical protein